MKAECIFRANASVGENPTWDWRSQRLFWVDVHDSVLGRFDPATGEAQTWSLPDKPGCFALTQDPSKLLFAMRHGASIFDMDSGAAEQIGPPPYDPERFFMNDGHCDRVGVLVVGSHDSQKKNVLDRPSSFYRFADGAFRPLFDDVGVANGLAFSPDNKTLYRSEFREGLILAYDYDSAAGAASNRRIFARIPDGMGMPDGAAVDQDGGYWVALFNGGCVVRFDPDGKLDRKVTIGARQATMLAFGGPDFRTVYVTSANRPGPAYPDVGEDAGAIFSFQSDIPGLPEPFATI